MGSFYAVTSGAVTASGDINQYQAVLNGSTAGQVQVKNATSPILAYLTSAPASDTTDLGASVEGDASIRAGLYIRGSDGYGGFRAGTGSALTAHLYAQSGGWVIPESLTVTTNLTVNGSTTVASLTASGSVSATGHLYDNGNPVPIQGPHSTIQPILSIVTATPTVLGYNEVAFQI